MALYRVLRSWVKPSGWVRPLSQQASDVNIDEAPAEDLIEIKRNKSRLKERHYNKLHGKVTHLSEDEGIAIPLWLQRKHYGVHGAASGISVAKLWPSKEELEMHKEWEKVARPGSVQQMISKAKKAKRDEEEALQQRQEEIKQKVAKLEGWKREVRERVQKHEREAQLAKEKKEKLIEEVRQIIGFQIDPRDERFKEALLKKEQEEKKAKKAAKKLANQKRLMQQLRSEADLSLAQTTDTASKEQTGSDDKSSISPGTPIM